MFLPFETILWWGKKLLKISLCCLIVLEVLGQQWQMPDFLEQAYSAHSFSFDKRSADSFFFDVSEGLTAMYVAYEITNNSGSAVSDLWAKIENFSGPHISLADFEDGYVHVGDMAAGASQMIFFYLKSAASGDVVTPETADINLYPSRDDAVNGSNGLDTELLLFATQDDTIEASSNKVFSALVVPSPPVLGGEFTITITGETGVLGTSNLAVFSPAAMPNWPANKIQLLSSEITFEYAAGPGDDLTYQNQLAITLPTSASTPYTAVYRFRAEGATSSPSALTPTAFINSGGTNMKHTDQNGFSLFDPLQPAVNESTVTLNITPTFLPGAGTVTYTITLSNSDPTTEVSLQRIEVLLPSNPDLVTYDLGSSSYGGGAIEDPSIDGQLLEWNGFFNVPANSSEELVFTVSIPATQGDYVVTTKGYTDGSQIDLTTDLNDDQPATATVTVGDYPDFSSSSLSEGDPNAVVSPGQVLDYSLTLNNSGDLTGTGIQVDMSLDPLLEELTSLTFTNCGGSLQNNSTDTVLDLDDVEIASGGVCEIDYQVTVKATAPGGSTIDHEITVSAASEGGSGTILNGTQLTVSSGTGSINGDLWKDDNGDGNKQLPDEGIENVSVDLYQDVNGDGVLDAGDILLETQLSDVAGAYSFTAVDPGDYLVYVTDTNLILSSLGITTNINPISILDLTGGEVIQEDFQLQPVGGRRRRHDEVQEQEALSVQELDSSAEASDNSLAGDEETGSTNEETLSPGKSVEENHSEVMAVEFSDFQKAEEISDLEPLFHGSAFLSEISEDPNCDGLNAQVCKNMDQIFGDVLGNVRAETVCTNDEEMFVFEPNYQCLELIPGRDLSFSDIDQLGDNRALVETLKNTRIIQEGDYIFSGVGNHSTGKQQLKYRRGEWEYQPDKLVTRIEVVKTALVSNCIPIADEIPIPDDGFRFKDIPVEIDPEHELMHFAARVYYTAYVQGIISGDEQGFAHPFDLATNVDILKILLNAAHTIPRDYQFSEGKWYERYVAFAEANAIVQKGLLPWGKMTRESFAEVLLKSMAYNPNPHIHGYVQRIDVNLKRYYAELPTYYPVPDLSYYDVQPNSCSITSDASGVISVL